MSIPTSDVEYLSSLRSKTVEALREVLGDIKDIAVVDAPNQRNVGDSLIWLGEREYIRKLGLRLRYVADLWSYDARDLRRALPRGGAVLLHGGGNFGDLWLGHQVLREKVATELADYKLIQLPQSVYFNDEARASEANQILGAHPDLHVLLRDSLSMERAALQLPSVSVAYCPDMALGWSPPASAKLAASDRQRPRVLVIARKDMEAASTLADVDSEWISGAQTTVTDWWPRGRTAAAWWVARIASRSYLLYVKVRRRMRFLPGPTADKLGAMAIDAISDANIAGALHLYSSADVIVVDRLHAHILAGLCGRPHVALDNSYKKVSAIFHDYSGGLSTATYASDIDEARSATHELVSEAR